MVQVFAGVAALADAVGQGLGHGAWHRVDQAAISRFAEATGDRQWIHVDTERAARGPFGRTVAHGYYLLAAMPVLLDEIFRVDGTGAVINTGVDRLRFHRPVPVDTRIRAAARLADVRVSRRGVAELSVEVTIEVEGVAEPACTAVVHSMVRPPVTTPTAQPVVVAGSR